MARVQRRDVGAGKRLALLAEFAVDPGHYGIAVAAEHPQYQAERPHVLAAQCVAAREPKGLNRIEGKPRHVQGDHLEWRERPVFQRVLSIARLAQVAFIEGAKIGYNQAARAHNRQVHLERRRVHRDQHVGFVARGPHGRGAEIDLEGRDAERRALGSADFRGIIRESGERISGKTGGKRELVAGQLHTVA